MTGYQEILTDPSYAGQIITFTFPHIGNVGVNDKDNETDNPAALGLIVRQPVTNPASWRAVKDLDLVVEIDINMPGISGIDTRALTRRIRDLGAPRGALCHAADGVIDFDALHTKAAAWPASKIWIWPVLSPAPKTMTGMKAHGILGVACIVKSVPNTRLWRWILVVNTIFCAASKTPDVQCMWYQKPAPKAFDNEA